MLRRKGMPKRQTRDFFISYTGRDEPWAEWLAWTLKEAGYSVTLQAWDFGAGSNFALEMHKAAQISDRTMCVLSEDFLKSNYAAPEWATAFADDPDGVKRKLVPVRVRPCKPDGLLKPLVYIDLVGKVETDAAEYLLQRLRGGPPDSPPIFPGPTLLSRAPAGRKPSFPAPSLKDIHIEEAPESDTLTEDTFTDDISTLDSFTEETSTEEAPTEEGSTELQPASYY